MANARQYFDTLKDARDRLALILGVDADACPDDVRRLANANIAVVAVLAKNLVDGGVLTDAQLQKSLNDAVGGVDGSTWTDSPVTPPPDTVPAFDTFPGEGFEAGTSGADATEANTAFVAGQVGDSMLPANGTCVFDSSTQVAGSNSLATMTANGFTRALRTDTYAATDTLYVRFYFRAASGPPASGSQVFSAQFNPSESTASAAGFGVGLDAAGWPAMFDGGIGRLAGTTPPSVCDGAWWRLEAAIYGTTCELRGYTGPNLTGTTAAFTFTGTYSAGPVNVVNIGQPYPLFGSGDTWTVYHDDVAISAAGWVGP